MVTDLVAIRTLAEAKETENLRFRRYLKAHHYPDRFFRAAAEEIARQIDCKLCANCCRETRVNVSESEIAALARYLKIAPEEVRRHYTEPDPGDPRPLLRHAGGGCVFLDGNLCLVYEARPRACREFPYLASGASGLGARMTSMCKRASYCPIVYNALETCKHTAGFHGCR